MALLEVSGVRARYGAIEALKGVSLTVGEGEVVTLIGSNGAGKSTTLRSICGLTPAAAGTITFAGEDITGVPADEIVTRGIALSPEGRRCFPRMTVRENLDLGAYRRRGAGAVAADMERVFALFPRLEERAGQKAGTMSGGEQQMLAIGRALMASPRLLLLDEPSLGIAPILVQRIYETIAEIHRSGVAILLVEQNAHRALDAAGRGYVLETGRVVLDDDTVALRDDPRVREAYLGDGDSIAGGPGERERNDRRARAVPAVRLADLGGGRGLAHRAEGLRRADRADARPGPHRGRPAHRAGAAVAGRVEMAARRGAAPPPAGHGALTGSAASVRTRK